MGLEIEGWVETDRDGGLRAGRAEVPVVPAIRGARGPGRDVRARRAHLVHYGVRQWEP